MLTPGHDGPAYKLIAMALDGGYEATGTQITEVADAFAAHQSALTGRFLAKACEQDRDVAGIAGAVADGARRGDREAVATAEVLFDDRRLSALKRLDFTDTVIDGASKTGDTDSAEALVERAADLVADSVSGPLDRRWADMLSVHERLRSVIGPFEADTERIEVLRRLGDLDQAVLVAEELFIVPRVASTRPTAQTTSSR